MKKILLPALLFLLLGFSCKGPGTDSSERVITVSIPPFKYFVEAIADSDFVVNVMLPPGADHHSWEPLPRQITALAGSEAFLTNGHLGFEFSWMKRFREVNPKMKVADLSKGITLLEPSEKDTHMGHSNDDEGVDPHYWMSPENGYIMAANVRDLLKELNPSQSKRYDDNYAELIKKIAVVDTTVTRNLASIPSRSFMIFHPALAYMARDYGLEQISFEDQGKMPSPARMKELIDLTRSKRMRVILVQAEYDVKSAQVLADETGARLIVIDPMNPEWDKAVIGISEALSGKTEKGDK
jgi:zinc transport system substrate-binding protein